MDTVDPTIRRVIQMERDVGVTIANLTDRITEVQIDQHDMYDKFTKKFIVLEQRISWITTALESKGEI